MSKRTGRPMVPVADRIRASVRIDPDSECWVWTKARHETGYGMMSIGSHSDGSRQTVYAHRISYETFVGSIPPGRVIDHRCRNRACVNPEHLEAVTTRLNALRREAARWGHAICERGHRQTPVTTRMVKGVPVCRTCEGTIGG